MKAMRGIARIVWKCTHHANVDARRSARERPRGTPGAYGPRRKRGETVPNRGVIGLINTKK